MGELIQPDDPMYEEGKLTAREWHKLEAEIDLDMPDFEFEMRVDTLKTPLGEIKISFYNLEVVQHGKDWSRYDHIVIKDTSQYPKPIYIFRNSYGFREEEAGERQDENWTKIAQMLLENDYTLVNAQERPLPHIMHMYWMAARGEETIESILDKVIQSGTEI